MKTSALTLEPGDRVPNFVLPNHQGNGIMFYNKTQGGPILLLLYDRNDDAVARSELAAFVERRDEFAALDAELFVINRDSPQNNAALVAEHDLDCPVMADIKGKITEALVAAVSTPGEAASFDWEMPVMVLVLDRNQRLLDSLRNDGRGLAEQSLELLRRAAPRVERQQLSDTAPVLVLPNMLAADLCRKLIGVWETQGHEEGLVAAVKDGKTVLSVDYGKKKRLDHVIRDDDLNGMLNRKIGPRLADAIFKAFLFKDFYLERWQIGVYQASRNDSFRPHRDNLSADTASRRFAISVNLNDDYEGGGVVFPEYGPHVYNVPAGAAVIFSCSHIHEALPVTRGRRFVLLSCLRDSKNQPHPWALSPDG